MSARARVIAATVLERVLEHGAFSQHALAAELGRGELAPRDRGWVTSTVYGVLSDLRAVDLAITRLREGGPDTLEPTVRTHVRMGVWELARSGREAAEAALVSAAVDGIKADGFPRRAGLVNGILRSMLRDKENLFNHPTKATEATSFGLDHGLPDWIAERLLAQWGDDAAKAMAAFNRPTRVALRVRGGDEDLGHIAAELTEEKFETSRHRLAPHALVCAAGNPAATEMFALQRIAIQDAGAQLALAALPRDIRGSILDACAGIGGKTLELSDDHPKATIVATDVNSRKLQTLKEHPGNEAVTTQPWDVSQEAAPDAVTAAGPFAAVVLDAPCSALGTLGRHPEVRWNRDPDVVTDLAALQREMLDRVAPLVQPGGWLLYIVCTWSAEETSGVVDAFMEAHPEFERSAPTAETAHPDVPWDTLVDGSGSFSLWPHLHDTDAFFVARFRRVNAA